MNSTISHITRSETPGSAVKLQNKGDSEGFAPLLETEKAANLVRQAGLEAQWEQIRQKNDNILIEISELVLKREEIFQKNSLSDKQDWLEFNKLTDKLRKAGLSLPLAEELTSQKNVSNPANTNTAVSSAPPSNNFSAPVPTESLINEENLLILSLENRDIGIRETLFGYGDQHRTLLPLRDIVSTLGFEIEVDDGSGLAKGWFISEDRNFTLDTTQNTVNIKGKTVPYDSNLVTIAEGDIFVDSSLLSSWFPVDLDVSRGELSVYVKPREILPIQAQALREEKWAKISGNKDLELKYPLVDNDYAAFSFPVVDVSLGGGLEESYGNDSNYRSRYSVIAEGDLAFMGARVFVSGNEKTSPDNARIRLSRQDPNGQLLGPLKAKEIALGDITPVNIPLLSSTGRERGIGISNRDLLRSTDFDTTRFEGDVLPGWDVELYRNGTLIEAQHVGEDGRYTFDKVPIFFGANSFKVLTFGPQGQQRLADEQDIRVGSSMLTPGKTEYGLSATQRKSTVLGINEQYRDTDDNIRLNGRFDFGLTKYISVNTGISSVEFDDQRHNYLQAGISGSLSSFYGQANYIHDTAGGSGLSLHGQTAIGSVNLKATHNRYFDLVAESNPDSTVQSTTAVAINGRTPQTGVLPPLSYTVSSSYTTKEDSDYGQLNARLSGRLGGLDISNTLQWNYIQEDDNDTEFEGNFQTSGYLGRSRLTGNLKYDLGEMSEITEYGVSAFTPINQDIYANTSLTRYNTERDSTTARASLNWDMGPATLSPSVSYDTEDGFGAFLNLSFSLGGNPASNKLVMKSDKRTGTGTASALVYHDVNNNRKFDEGDTPLPEVKVIAQHARRGTDTDDDGVALLTGLSPHKPTDVEIDVETLEDPFWTPVIDGTAITPRAGTVNRLEFPVVTTGEIDGTIYLQDSSGNTTQLRNVTLEIVDREGEVTQSTKSEFDGFYLFQRVFPGTYTLRISPEEQFEQIDVSAYQIEIEIGNDGTIASGNDLVLQDLSSGVLPSDIPDEILTQEAAEEEGQRDASLIAASRSPASSSEIATGSAPIASIRREKSKLIIATGESTPGLAQLSQESQQSRSQIQINPLVIEGRQTTSAQIEEEKTAPPTAATPTTGPAPSIRINPLQTKSQGELPPLRPKILNMSVEEEQETTDTGGQNQSTINIQPLVAQGNEPPLPPYPPAHPEKNEEIAHLTTTKSKRVILRDEIAVNNPPPPLIHLRAIRDISVTDSKKIFIPAQPRETSIQISPLAMENRVSPASHAETANLANEVPSVQLTSQPIVHLGADSPKRYTENRDNMQQKENEDLTAAELEEMIAIARLEHALERPRAERGSSQGMQKKVQPIAPVINPIGSIIRPIDLNLQLEANLQNPALTARNDQRREQPVISATQKYAAIQLLGRKFI